MKANNKPCRNIIYLRIPEDETKHILKIGRTKDINQIDDGDDEFDGKKYNIGTKYECISQRKFTTEHAKKIVRHLAAMCQYLGGHILTDHGNWNCHGKWVEFRTGVDFHTAIYYVADLIELLDDL